jgi:hypothetical protein
VSAEIVPRFCVCCYPRLRSIHKALDRGAQAVVRGGARCLLRVFGSSAKIGACGHSFALLSTQVSAGDVRHVRHKRLTCGGILEVSRDDVAAGEEQLVRFAAEQNIYCFICTLALGSCGDYFSRGVAGSVFAAALTKI